MAEDVTVVADASQPMSCTGTILDIVQAVQLSREIAVARGALLGELASGVSMTRHFGMCHSASLNNL
jgi:hypothetical protein